MLYMLQLYRYNMYTLQFQYITAVCGTVMHVILVHITVVPDQDMVSWSLYWLPQDQYGGLRRVFQKTFLLLKAMARKNHVVQGRLFDRLDMLLSKEGAAGELAECLTEVSHHVFVHVLDAWVVRKWHARVVLEGCMQGVEFCLFGKCVMLYSSFVPVWWDFTAIDGQNIIGEYVLYCIIPLWLLSKNVQPMMGKLS